MVPPASLCATTVSGAADTPAALKTKTEGSQKHVEIDCAESTEDDFKMAQHSIKRAIEHSIARDNVTGRLGAQTCPAKEELCQRAEDETMEFEEDTKEDRKDSDSEGENLDDFITKCLLEAVTHCPSMGIMEWEAEIETDPTWSPLASPSAFEHSDRFSEQSSRSLPNKVHDKVIGTLHLVAKKISDKVQLTVNFVVNKWEATDDSATETLHWSEDFVADKTYLVSERVSEHSGHVRNVLSHTATVSAERAQKGVQFVKSMSRELSESERVQQSLGYAREKSEPLQRGLVYAKGKADAAGEVARVVSGRVSAQAEALGEKLERGYAHTEKCIGMAVVKAETATERASEGLHTGLGQVNTKMQKSKDFMAERAETVSGRASEGLQTSIGLAKERSENINAQMQKSVDFVAGKAEAVTAQVAVKAQVLHETSSKLQEKLEATLRSPARSKNGGA